MKDDNERQIDGDSFLSRAIESAISDGKGWKPGEKEEYISRLLDDEYIPPLFADNVKDVLDSGLADAFEALRYDDPPSIMMANAKKRGNDAFGRGRKNVAKNAQYYRDAINSYYEALFFADRVVPLDGPDDAPSEAEADGPLFCSRAELDSAKSALRSNAAMAHMMLRNWGHARDDARLAVALDGANVKGWHRLAKSMAMLGDYEGADDAVARGLESASALSSSSSSSSVSVSAADEAAKELSKLRSHLRDKIERARSERQRRERMRQERIASVTDVWRHCSHRGIRLGRVPLVAAVAYDDDDDGDDEGGNFGDGEAIENAWHYHLPHTGSLPKRREVVGGDGKRKDDERKGNVRGGGVMTWPAMFLYPSHRQSDFVDGFREDEMLAVKMAEMFPELEDEYDEDGGAHNDDEGEAKKKLTTDIAWDHNDEFVCSKLAVYFEVHGCCRDDKNKIGGSSSSASDPAAENGDREHRPQQKQPPPPTPSLPPRHPDQVDLLRTKDDAIRFYESSRALRGDEGPELAEVVRCAERKRMSRRVRQWKEVHGSLWHRPDDEPLPVVRVHPAMTLGDILVDERMVVPNFLVTFLVFPEDHPAHLHFLRERTVVGVLQPKVTAETG